MKWVTRARPKVDRVASAWLIKRFVDLDAEFVFVERHDPVPTGAIPFTLPGAEINPVEGVSTTYDALVAKYRIDDRTAVAIQAAIHDSEVDAAEELTRLRRPESAVLAMILRGLSRVSESDQENVERAIVMLDALASELRGIQETSH